MIPVHSRAVSILPSGAKKNGKIVSDYYILYPEQKTFTSYYALYPLHYKQICPWEVCSLDDPWSFAASHSLMHFINRCTWKSLQSYITTIMMTSLLCVSEKLVFHQSKCISAIKRKLSITAMYISSSSFVYLCFPSYCDACLKSSALCVGVKTLRTQYNNVARK